MIAGINGYIGTALRTHLLNAGHEVFGFDNGSRDLNAAAMKAGSIVKKEIFDFELLDAACVYEDLKKYIKKNNPDTIVWLAEQPSAPFSMLSPRHCNNTLTNNIIGTMNVLNAIKEVNPEIHLIKLGTEGEYPDWIWNGKKIPEGHRMTVQHNGENWEIPTPRYFGSWYHSTKFYESYLIDYACKIWGLRATDVNQGIVYGHRNGTRLDVDYYFGTVVHRFVAQAVAGVPMTVFGEGGQTRGMICIQDSIEAIRLLIENPTGRGDFRVIHQTTKEYSVMQVAEMIKELIPSAEIKKIENPRAEMTQNKFTFDNTTLMTLRLEPTSLEEELPKLIELVKANKENIKIENLMPEDAARWK